MGRKSMWRGHWLSSAPTLPGRTEVGLMPNAQVHTWASTDTPSITAHINSETAPWLLHQRCWMTLYNAVKMHMLILGRLLCFVFFISYPWFCRRDLRSHPQVWLYNSASKRGDAVRGAGQTVLLSTCWGGLLPCTAPNHDQVTFNKLYN